MAGWLAVGMLASTAPAQVVQGVQIGDAPAFAPETAPVPSAQAIVRVFVEACVLTEGDQMAAVDWAVSQGFNPLDVTAPSVEPLLAGRPGTVLAMPSQQQVWLVAAAGGPCTVWAERSAGPPLHLALQQAMSQLAAKGARVQSAMERNIERAGAWRRQVQWRYRRVGGSQDFGVGAVTTLGDQPAAQALHLERLPPAASQDPDGLPQRQ